MERQRRKNYIFKEKEIIQALFLVWSLYFLKKILYYHARDSFLVTNIAGSWIIFFIVFISLRGKIVKKRVQMKCILEIKVERFLLPCSMNSYLKYLSFSFYISLNFFIEQWVGKLKNNPLELTTWDLQNRRQYLSIFL